MNALIQHVNAQFPLDTQPTPPLGSSGVERGERCYLQDQRDEYAEILHDLVMLKAQDDIGCVPPPTAAQWAKAWRRAEEKFEP